MEILVVVAMVGLLLSLAIGAHSFATSTALRNRTIVMHKGILNAMEVFKTEHQVYPEPAHPGETATLDSGSFQVGGAMMLYQLLSADGTDQIKPAVSAATASDGRTDENEAARVLFPGMEPGMWREVDGRYVLIDSYGHPFQFSKGGTPGAVNETFDVWSFGGDVRRTADLDETAKRDGAITGRWIKNF